MEPDETGVPRIEIDESELFGSGNRIIWMLGLIDRYDNSARVFCVMYNRTKENILFYIINNVLTQNFIEGNLDLRTRVYSDCFSVYQQNDFANLGYVLHRVNHSVWFGQGRFHTNSIEWLWACLKRISNNFVGLNFNLLDTLEKKGKSTLDFLNGWICYCLFFRDCERLKLTAEKIENLCLIF